MKAYKFLLLVSILLFSSTQLIAESSELLGYEVVGNRPVFYDKLQATLTYPMAWENSDKKDFHRWKEDARSKLLECISPAPPFNGFDMRVIAEEQRNGYVAQKVLLNLSTFSQVLGYLLTPEGGGLYPAILMLHDHGAHFSIGKEKMIKPFEVDSMTLNDSEDWISKCYDTVYVGDYFAQKGYVVFITDALLWGDRKQKGGTKYEAQQTVSAGLLQMGMSLGGLIVWDDIRSLDFLSSLPMVDRERVGVLGFSMGGYRAWMLAAASSKVKAAASICWMTTTESQLSSKGSKGGSDYSMLIPGVRNFLDHPHIASIACPTPMLFYNGRYDKLFPMDGVLAAFDKMREVWISQSAEDRYIAEVKDTPHVFSKDMQQQVLIFFNRWLIKKEDARMKVPSF